MTPINRWYLGCQNRVAPTHQFVTIFYDESYAPCAASSVGGDYVTVQSLGNGTIALQLLDGGANPFASMVPGAYGLRMQFQNELGNWCTQVGASSTFQPIPTGDGYFALLCPGSQEIRDHQRYP